MGGSVEDPYKRIEKKKILRVFIREPFFMSEIEEIKSSLMKIVLEYDDEYYEEDNVIYAKNAFLVNSVLSWYFDQETGAQLNIRNIGSVLDLLNKHVKKEISIFWKDNDVQILYLKEKTKQRKNESTKNS